MIKRVPCLHQVVHLLLGRHHDRRQRAGAYLCPALFLRLCECVDSAQHRPGGVGIDLVANAGPQRVDQQRIGLGAIAAILDLCFERAEQNAELAQA